MAKKPTFHLNLPADKQVETYTVQLANGLTVTRTVHELRAPTAEELQQHG